MSSEEERREHAAQRQAGQISAGNSSASPRAVQTEEEPMIARGTATMPRLPGA